MELFSIRIQRTFQLVSTITAMLYLCNAIDEGHTFKEKLLALFKEYADVPIYKIGFFNRWEEEPIWKKRSE